VRNVLLAILGLAVLGGLGYGVMNFVEYRRTVREVNDLRNRVYDARMAADSCRNVLDYREMLFHRFDTLVASLRDTVAIFEEMDERGVPEEEYDAYMRAFEGYNDSVAVWESRADSLKATEAICRSLVEKHNLLADSFRNRLMQEGVMEGAGGG
jgi:hypothetical protein